MPRVIINGLRREFPEGTTLLGALRKLGIDIPALCHDDRLAPCGACRLCAVEIRGWPRPATACNTTLAEGMDIQTHSATVEQARRTVLRLLAREHPADAAGLRPAKEFHRWLRHYGITIAGPGRRDPFHGTAPEPSPTGAQALRAPEWPNGLHDGPAYADYSHPYIQVDMSRCITCYRCVRFCREVQGRAVWNAWNRGSATRILPGEGTGLREAGCVSCGGCVDTCPTGALEDRTVLALGTPSAWTRTTCPYCGVGCEMMVGTRESRIVQVRPAMDAAVNKGHLCVKGRYAFQFVTAADRVLGPMIRDQSASAPQTQGPGWRAAGWETAIAHAAGNLRRIISAHGPGSVAVLASARGTNEENYLAQKFARVVLGTNNVDCCARVCHAPTAAAMKSMLGAGAATHSFEDIEAARGFLLCGVNPTENHPIVGARIRQAAGRGAALIVIDPRRTELARAADVHLPVRPGGNVPLLNAMACAIVEEGLFDESGVPERTAGWDEFRAFIRGFAPETAAGLCGVDAGLIRAAARLYATVKPAMCFHGLGVTEHSQGTEGVMCLVNLALLTGNLGGPGCGVNPLRGQNNVQGAAHMGCDPRLLPGSIPLEEGRHLFEATWRAPLPRAEGLNLLEMIDAAAAGRLKALWVIGYGIESTNPNAAVTRAALARLEFLMVQDLFLEDWARTTAHVFLPACSSFEKEGTFMNSERRVQRVRRAIDPVGHSRPDWEIICAVARAMDAPGSGGGETPDAAGRAGFEFRSPEEIWNEIRTVWKAGAGMSYERLEGGGLQWPCPDEAHPGTAILHTGIFAPGRRAPLMRVPYAPTAETTTAEYPYLLTTGRTLYQFNAGTMTGRTPNILLRESDTLDMAPADAARLGFQDGDQVRLRSRHGEATLPLRLDPHLKAGELFATFHSASTLLNNLTGPYRDRIVMTPEYKVVAVRVDRIGGR